MSIPVPKYTLYDRKDIEVLVAYILYKVGSITKDELMRCTVDHDFVMYFDLICCLFDMEDKGLIICEKAGNDETCLPTAKSEYLAIELAYTIPLSIREDTIYYAKKITSHSRLEKTVTDRDSKGRARRLSALHTVYKRDGRNGSYGA